MKSWFKNLSVGKKMASAFLMLILLILIIAVAGFYFIQKTNSHIDRYSLNLLPADDLLLNIDRDMQQILVSERTLLIPVTGKADFNSLIKDINENYEQINDRWEKFKSVAQETNISEKISEFEKYFEAWKSSTKGIIHKLESSGKSEYTSVENTALNENASAFTSARNVIDELEDVINKEAKNLHEESDSFYHSAVFLFLTGLLIYLLIALPAGFFFFNMIRRALKNTAVLISDLGNGKLNSRIKVEAEDEFGQIGRTLNKFADDLQKYVIGSMQSISEGNFNIEIPSKGEGDEIAPAINNTVIALKELTSEINRMSEWARQGDLESRGNAEKFNGGYKEIVKGLNTTILEIISKVRTAENVMMELAEGDLTARMTGDYKGNYKKLQGVVNKLAESLENIVSEVHEAVSATADSSSMISSGTEEMAAGSQEQSIQTAEVASAVEQMARTIIETTKNAGMAFDIAKEAGSAAKNGGKVVDETIKRMVRIAEVVQKSSMTIKQLGQSSGQIGEIIQVIDDIADQTNLLALNAAIEAARAGEQGRGFAVVADEVRKLAERTTKATKEISAMIKQIQNDTKDAVKAIDEGNAEVETGKEMAGKAGDSLRDIIDAANRVLDVVNNVASASEEQSSAAEQISKNIEAISSVTQQSSDGIHQIARTAEDLNRLTDKLRGQVNKFKINGKAHKVREKASFIKSNGQLVEN